MDKSHKFILPKNLFTPKGVVRRGSPFAQMMKTDTGTDAVDVKSLKPDVVRQIVLSVNTVT